MGEVTFMISEAAKQVHVESHVLRYWEEELNLEIGRTELGHRYYTKDDILLFQCIKKLKSEGMLLRDLKPLIPKLKKTRSALMRAQSRRDEAMMSSDLSGKTSVSDSPDTSDKSSNFSDNSDVSLTTLPSKHPEISALTITDTEVSQITQLEQAKALISDVLSEIISENNKTLEDNITKRVTQDVLHEMNYLFQAKERREEEHFRKLDCLIRQQQANRKEAVKTSPVRKLKKIFT